MADDWPEPCRCPRASAGGQSCATSAAEVIDIADPNQLLSPVQRRWLRDQAVAAAHELGLTGEVRVRLVADAAMAAVHERFSGIPGTTDVLTFDLREPAASAGGSGSALDADIYACVDEARRQTAARGHSVERELLLYILHGILHCLGHDDHDDAAYEHMHAEEDRVLHAIGVGPVFAAPARERGG